MKPQRIEISYKTIIFTVVFLASLSLLWQIRGLLILVYVCFILMATINRPVSLLEKKHLPRPLAVIIIYLLFFIAVSFALASLIPALVSQTNSLIKVFPTLIQQTSFLGTSAIDWSSQFKIIESLPSNIAKATLSIFSNALSTFIIFMITFYLLEERSKLKHYGFKLFGKNGGDKLVRTIELLEVRLSSWVNAQLMLMLIVGFLSYFGYLALGLNYALPLAIIAGILELVPNIGPTIAAIIAALVGLTISPLTALLAIIWGTIVQQLENNFIVPKVMKEAVGINPLVTLLCLAAGAKIGGVVGTILSIPTYLFVESIVKTLNSKNISNTKLQRN